jgi:hypothetical protein
VSYVGESSQIAPLKLLLMPTNGLEWRVFGLCQQHEVPWLDVPMQNTVAVALSQRAQHSPHVTGHLTTANGE